MAMLRVLLLLGAFGALTAWVVATGMPASDGRQASAARAGGRAAPARAEVVADGRDSLSVEVDRLRAGLAGMPLPSSLGRNPFRFGTRLEHRGERRAAGAGATRAGAEPSNDEGEASDRPPMRLLGIAEDVAEQGPVRTAVIATPRQLYLVREGEQIAMRFLVTRVGADAVELRDLATDSTVRLPLP